MRALHAGLFSIITQDNTATFPDAQQLATQVSDANQNTSGSYVVPDLVTLSAMAPLFSLDGVYWSCTADTVHTEATSTPYTFYWVYDTTQKRARILEAGERANIALVNTDDLLAIGAEFQRQSAIAAGIQPALALQAPINADRSRIIAAIAQQPQHQGALNEQLNTLYQVGVKLGLYDACDLIRGVPETIKQLNARAEQQEIAALKAECEQLKAKLAQEPTEKDLKSLRTAMMNAGLSAPASQETLAFNFLHHSRRLFRASENFKAMQASAVLTVPLPDHLSDEQKQIFRQILRNHAENLRSGESHTNAESH